jgi:hypothetical protein
MASSSARALFPLFFAALLPACSETPPREVTPWATTFSVLGSANINALSVDPYSGGVALAGTFSGTMDLGSGPEESYFGSDLFVAELADSGTPSWGGHTGGASYLGQQGVVVAPNGDVVATGMFTDSIGFGGAPLKTTGQASYLVRFDAAGNLIWQLQLGSEKGVVTAATVAIDAEDNIVIAGSFYGEVNLAGTDLVSPGQAAFVAKFDPSGQPIFGHGYAGSGHSAIAVACDAFGGTVIYGRNSGDLFAGDTELIAAGQEAFVAKLDRAGKDLWAIALRSAETYMQPTSLGLSPAGEVVVAGAFFSAVQLGTLEAGAVNQSGTAFVGKLSSEGKPLWLQGFGGDGPNGNIANAVAVGSAGEIYLAGNYAGNADLGTGPLPSANSSSLFVSELDAGGTTRVVRTFDEAGSIFTSGQSLTLDPQGGLIVAGALNGGMIFDGKTLRSPENGYSVFIARLKTPL